MSFKDYVADLAERANTAVSVAQTEEATKNAVIMPFIRVLGFDVFDPTQVVPEFIADVGIKKGEKVDYALYIEGRHEFLIECKSISANLKDAQYNQLFRYFTVTDASIAILTNGLQYWFFTDVDETNKMDSVPFFKFDLTGYDDNDIRELENFTKDKFNVTTIKSRASALKYTRAAIAFLDAQWSNPDDDFVRLVARNFYEGNLTKQVVEGLRPNIKRAFDELVRQKIRQRLAVAFDDTTKDASSDIDIENSSSLKDDQDDIDTTNEEIQGLHIVRAIAAEVTDLDRITMRDQKSYCGVLFDDNNRKPIIRMHFNGRRKFITTFAADKASERADIDRLEDIFKHKSKILDVIQSYQAEVKKSA